MSTTELEQAQAALDAAQARHDAEQAAKADQAREGATAYWTHVHVEVLPDRVQAMQAAREAFTEAVRDATDPAGAYAAYVRAHAVWQAAHNLVADGLAVWVDDLTGVPHPDPEERWGRPTYPPGVQGPTHHAVESFTALLDRAVEAAHAAHKQAASAELRAGLEAPQ